MHHAFLQPDGRDFEADGFVHHVRDELGAAEDVHDIDFLRRFGQRRDGLFAQRALDRRIHGNNAVAVALQVGGNAVAGAQRAIGKAHHRDGFASFEQFADFVGCDCRHDHLSRKAAFYEKHGGGEKVLSLTGVTGLMGFGKWVNDNLVNG